ncbi:hypothetical protein N2152v2_009632 [Parachlorella kessleri]
MEATVETAGPALDFNWAHYGGAMAAEALQHHHHATVPQQEMVPSGAPPSLPLFTDAAQQDAAQGHSQVPIQEPPSRTNSEQPELNIHSRPRRRTQGSKRYRNEEFVSVPDDEERGPSASSGGKRGRGAGGPAAAAQAAAEPSALDVAAAAAPPMATSSAEAAVIGQVAPEHYHQTAAGLPHPQEQQMQGAEVGEESVMQGDAVAYHHHHAAAAHAAADLEQQAAMAAAAAAAAAAQQGVLPQDAAMMQQQMSLQLDQDLPLPGRVVPKLPAKPTDQLNSLAMQTLASQDAASHDQYLKLLRFDDQIAELASRRGLLVRFLIKSVKTYQPQPEMVVEAPEFMTVEYLKRRIMKAKLLRGEFVNPIRFILRKKILNENNDLVGMEDVASREPTGDEIFLFHQGYEAPGPYELFIASVPQTTDREQQERILGLHPQQAQQHGPDPGAVDASRLSYQQLLQAPGMPGAAGAGQLAGMAAASGAMQQLGPHGEMPASSAALGMEMPGVLDQQQAVSLHSGMLAGGGLPMVQAMPVLDGTQQMYGLAHEEGGSVAGLTEKSPKPRRQTGRWMPEEVEALIEGVTLFKTSWAQIYERYVVTNKINSKRTQVDLKDKWRNLVKLVTDPNKHARGMDLSEDQRQTILRLVFANDIPATGNTADFGTTSADQGAGTAGAAQGAGAEVGTEGQALAGDQQLPVEGAVPVADMSQADMTALLQSMYAQYHQLGLPLPDPDTLQQHIQQQIQQQQFLQQQAAHMSPEDIAAMQAQHLQGLEAAMDPAHLAAMQAQMDPQQFAAYQQQLLAQQQAVQHHLAMDPAALQQYQQARGVDASQHYAAEHYGQPMDEETAAQIQAHAAAAAAAAVAAAEHMQQQQQQQQQQEGAHEGQGPPEDEAAAQQHQHQHDPAALHAAIAAAHAQQHAEHGQQAQQGQHVVDPLQPLTEETLDLPPLTAQ